MRRNVRRAPRPPQARTEESVQRSRQAGPPRGRRPGRLHRGHRPAARLGRGGAGVRVGHPGHGARLPDHAGRRAPDHRHRRRRRRVPGRAGLPARQRRPQGEPEPGAPGQRPAHRRQRQAAPRLLRQRRPSRRPDLGSRAGWYPDPLVPRDFGATQTVPGSVNPGPTTPFYVLVHVPYGTPAGTYAATLHVENGCEVVDLPVRAARLGLRLGEHQHPLRLRHRARAPSSAACRAASTSRARTRPRCCTASTPS